MKKFIKKNIGFKKNLSSVISQLSTERGFTLVELLIYMGIFSILLLVLIEIFVASLSVQLESRGSSSVYEDGRFITSRIAYDIERSDSLSIPSNIGDEVNTLQVTTGGINYSYSLNGSDFEITDNLGTERLNSFNTNISNLKFKRLGNPNGKNSIKVSFTVTTKTQEPKGFETKDFQTTISTR